MSIGDGRTGTFNFSHPETLTDDEKGDAMSDFILDEIREKVRANNEWIQNNPAATKSDKEFAEVLIEFFDDIDAVDRAPESFITECLFFIGYEFDELNTVYNTLINDIRQVYKLVDPEFLTINIVEKKKPRWKPWQKRNSE